MIIVPFRQQVRRLLLAGASVPVYGYLPDDIAHLPCICIGRPSLFEGDVATVMRATLTITLLGRRINDEDSQAQLDALGDELFELLGGTRLARTTELSVACRSFTPGTVIVGGLEMPAYLATVTTDALSC